MVTQSPPGQRFVQDIAMSSHLRTGESNENIQFDGYIGGDVADSGVIDENWIRQS